MQRKPAVMHTDVYSEGSKLHTQAWPIIQSLFHSEMRGVQSTPSLIISSRSFSLLYFHLRGLSRALVSDNTLLFSIHSRMLYAPSIAVSLIWSPEEYLMNSRN
jgi:hypothetical protein